MRQIDQGQYVHPRYAAEHYIGTAYVLVDEEGSMFSAHPADYDLAPDSTRIGAIIRTRHPFRTITGGIVVGPRLLKSDATMADLRRLARAAEALVA